MPIKWMRKPNSFFLICGMFACLSGCAAVEHRVPAARSASQVRLSPANEARVAFFAAQLADSSGEFQKAIRYYYQALVHDPGSLTIRRHLIGDLIRLERFHEARKEYDVIIENDTGDSQSRYMLGQLFEAVGDIDMAETLYRDAIGVSTEHSGPFTKLGILLLRQDKPHAAIPFLEKALTINRADREARRILVNYYLTQNQPVKSEHLLLSALEDTPDDVEWLNQLAGFYTNAGKKEKAATVYQQLLASHSKSIEAHRFLSIYYLKQNDWDGAIRQLEQLLQADPKDPLARRNLGLALYKLGEYREARRHLEMLLQRESGDALTHYLMGSIYRKFNLNYLAVDQFSVAKKLDKDMVEAHLGLAGALMKINELERATVVLQEASFRFSKIYQVWLNYGLVMLRQKNPEKALVVLKKAMLLSPKDVLVYFHTGRAYNEAGQFEKAVTVWKQALGLDPEFADVYNHLGYLYAEQGKNLEQAGKWLEKALALRPGNGYYLDSLGWIYYKQGKFKLALQKLVASRDCFKNNGQRVDSVIYDHLGDVYYQLEQYRKAKEAWQQALELEPENKIIRNKLEKRLHPGEDANYESTDLTRTGQS
ncbi:tetratricopeptide repeat protein [bacterium]|nr:tetratricopeptide repeat protein [bacterium]